MDGESAMVTGALCRVLRVLRVFGVAPLRLKRRHTVTVVRVWTERLRYGYVLATVLNIMVVTAIILKIIARIGTNTTLVGRVMQVITLSNTILLVSTAAYGAHKRMKHLLILLRQLHKITILIPNESIFVNDKKRTRQVSISLVVVLFIGVISFGIHLHNIFCRDLTKREVLVMFLLSANHVQAIIATMLAVQIVTVIQMMRKAVESYNSELERLLDEISKGHHRDATLLKLEESLWCIGWYYMAFCENVRTMITNEGTLILQVIVFFVVQLMSNSFRIVLAVSELSGPEQMGGQTRFLPVIIILYLFLFTLHVIILWALVNACDKIHEEVQQMRASVSEVMYRGREVGGTLSTAMGALCQQILSLQPNFKPLDVCALTRSLFVTVISGVITYLVTFIKFYIMEAMHD